MSRYLLCNLPVNAEPFCAALSCAAHVFLLSPRRDPGHLLRNAVQEYEEVRVKPTPQHSGSLTGATVLQSSGSLGMSLAVDPPLVSCAHPHSLHECPATAIGTNATISDRPTTEVPVYINVFDRKMGKWRNYIHKDLLGPGWLLSFLDSDDGAWGWTRHRLHTRCHESLFFLGLISICSWISICL